MSAFHQFALQLKARFDEMSQHELFVTNPDKDQLWANYLAAFPAGSNPIFRTRTEHDCSCCRNFVKNLANVVAIVDGKLVTLWDNSSEFEYPYDVVANELYEWTRDHPITDLFRADVHQFGTEKSYEAVPGGTPIE